jgi:coenzyme F420-reducing hydrogenase gamma subunit
MTTMLEPEPDVEHLRRKPPCLGCGGVKADCPVAIAASASPGTAAASGCLKAGGAHTEPTKRTPSSSAIGRSLDQLISMTL